MILNAPIVEVIVQIDHIADRNAVLCGEGFADDADVCAAFKLFGCEISALDDSHVLAGKVGDIAELLNTDNGESVLVDLDILDLLAPFCALRGSKKGFCAVRHVCN